MSDNVHRLVVPRRGNEGFLAEITSARGLAVRISAVHMCKTHRGVKASQQIRMVNTAFIGELLHDKSLKHEFLQECLALERHG